MNNFFITNMEMKEQYQMYSPWESDYPRYASETTITANIVPSIEITLRPRRISEDDIRRLQMCMKNSQPLELNDRRFVDIVEPLKYEFMHFMMEKHPEKILAYPDIWERLIGRR